MTNVARPVAPGGGRAPQPGGYWLARWIDDRGIRHPDDIGRRLRERNAGRAIMAAVESDLGDPFRFMSIGVTDGVLAGGPLDLSGALNCSAYECIRRNIDGHFARVFHYFNRIVVGGLSPYYIALYTRLQDEQQLRWIIDQHARVLLYLRQVGAEKYVTFTEKGGLCRSHYGEQVSADRLLSAFDKSDLERLVQRISKSSSFICRQQADSLWHFSIDGPFFHEPYYGSLTQKKQPSKRAMARQAATRYSFSLVTDLAYSKIVNLPLAGAITQSRLARGHQPGRLTESDVALHLNLPVLDQLDIATFLRFREDHQQHFESFRTALASAVSQQLSRTSSASDAANAVVREFVAPSLSEIERSAKALRRTSLSKSALNFSIGTSSTIVSLTDHIP